MMNAALQNAALPAENRREGQIELLRVVSMLLILGHHLAWHGAALQSPNRMNQVIACFLFAGGMAGVNCFVMITGYFQSAFRAKRFFSILLETLFYSVGLTLLSHFLGWRQDVTAQTVWDAALVISRSPYWFVVMYLGLTALLPVLRPGVKAMKKNAHRWVLIFFTVYLSVIPTLTFQNPSSHYFHQLTWFIYLYLLGAYFGKYPSRFTRCAPLHGAVFLISTAFIAASCLWGREHQELFQRVGSRQNFFADKNTVPQLINSCALFLFLANLRVKPVRALTLLSGASFGVYLIHDHSLIRGRIWGNWLKIWQACQLDNFWLTALCAPVLIYLCCAAIDLARKYLLEKPLMKGLSPVLEKIDGWMGKE